MATPTPPVSPAKRKRGDDHDASLRPTLFPSDLSRTLDLEDGDNSPRCKVAHKFRGLGLESTRGQADGVGAPGPLYDTSSPAEDAATSGKRRHVELPMRDAPPSPGITDRDAGDARAPVEPRTSWQQHEPAVQGGPHRAYPSINRLSASRSGRQRCSGSPPLRRSRPLVHDPDEDLSSSDPEADIVDPVRAALTWRENEITVYDPDDEDDDGTGINGVGFKPTPALAHARAMKRKQQMAEYRRREENDARTRRSEMRTRRGKVGMTVEVEDEPSEATSRKVRFTEAHDQTLPLTTG